MKIRFIPILLTVLCSTPNIFAASNGSSNDTIAVMTLHDCMEYAVKYSTKNEIQKLDNSDKRIERRDAILKAFTPSVSAGTYAYTNFGRAVDPETNTYINSTSFNNGYSINASLTLFDGFSAIDNIKISQTAVKMGISEEEKLRNELCLAVMEAYCNVLFHSEMTEVLTEQVEIAKTNLNLINKQYELGQKSYPDVAQTEADLADKEYLLVNSVNNRDDALLTLKSIMLWPIEKELRPDMSMLENDNYSILFDNESEDEIINYALATQPSVLIAEGSLKKAKYALHTAKWQFLPSLSLSGGWSTSFYSYPGRADSQTPSFWSQWKNNSGQYIQLNLSIPIYDRLSRFSNLSKKRNDYRRAEAQYRQTLQDVESEVSRALQDKRGAIKALVHAEKKSDAQKETFLLHEKKMKQGLISPVEYQTISNSYLNSCAEKLDARLKLFLKNSVVNYYKGIGYLEQETKIEN